MFRVLNPLTLALILAGTFFGSTEVRAWPYYVEFGGTTASLSTPSPLFESQGKTASTSASSSYGVPFTVGIHLQERQKGILFSLALQARYLSGTTGAGQTYASFPTSPIFRMEIWRFVLGAGYTPWIWKDFTFKRNSALNSMLTLEAQFLFPITPEIDFGLSGTRTSYTSSLYGNGPTVMEYGAFFRLNFGMSEAVTNERRKFKGWRYPFGSPLR
jgi:hypothetical protein